MSDFITAEGVVLDSNRDVHTVEVTIGTQRMKVLCRRAGRLQTNRVRVMPGDVVTIEVSAYDVTRGRIIYRGRKAA